MGRVTAAQAEEARRDVQHVALAHSPEERVRRLRQLAEQVADRYLVLAVALHEEHLAGLWEKARIPGGAQYESEEQFWEEALGLKRRSAYQLLAIGRVLARIDSQEEARAALAEIGLYKADVLVPVLERTPDLATVRAWAEVAHTHSRDALRERVREALGRRGRAPGEPGSRIRAALVNAMPTLETRQLGEEFFEVGARYVESDHPVAILIAGFQECLGTWSAHLPRERVADASLAELQGSAAG